MRNRLLTFCLLALTLLASLTTSAEASPYQWRNEGHLLNADNSLQEVLITSGQGAPSSVSMFGATMGLYLRENASAADAALYLTYDGSTWYEVQTTAAGGSQADLIFDAATELTIASGVVTAVQGYHDVDTESNAASDDLDTISGLTDGELSILRPESGARTVVIKHGTGNIYLPGGNDCSLAELTDWALVMGDGSNAAVLACSTLADYFQPADAELEAVAGLSGTGIVAHTGGGTMSERTLTAPAAGITIADGDGVSGNPTLSLADDLAALEALDATAGYITKTAADTYARRTLTGTADQVSITNGDGTTGDPVFSLPQSIATTSTPTFGTTTFGVTSKFGAEDGSKAGTIVLAEQTGNGTDKVSMAAPAALTADRTITVPDADVTLADIATNTSHRTSSGADHSYIDQSVVSGATPTFGSTTFGVTSQFRGDSAAAAAAVILAEDTDNGTDTVTMAAPAALTAARTITVPDADVNLGYLDQDVTSGSGPTFGTTTFGVTSKFGAEDGSKAGTIVLAEQTGNGTDKVSMAAPAALTADRTITVPDADVDLSDIATNTADILALSTAPTLTPGAEAANVIAVTFASPVASAEQYVAVVYDTNTETNGAAFRLAETGVGAEVSTTAKARLVFTSDASGAATISVTDVAGASSATVYLVIEPLFISADTAQQVAPVMVAATFDAA